MPHFAFRSSGALLNSSAVARNGARNMKILRGTLSKGVLLAASERDRRLFLSCAHLQNELNFLHRAVLWCGDLSSEYEVQHRGQLAMTLFYLRLLAGKASEGWEMFRKLLLASADARELERELVETGKAALGKLKRYFGKQNLVSNIRNNFAFHFSPEQLESHLEKTDESLDLFLESTSGVNSLFYFAEVLATSAIIEQAGAKSIEEGFEAVVKEVIGVAGDLVSLADATLHALLTRFGMDVWSKPMAEVPLPELRAFESVSMPWLVDTHRVERT